MIDIIHTMVTMVTIHTLDTMVTIHTLDIIDIMVIHISIVKLRVELRVGELGINLIGLEGLDGLDGLEGGELVLFLDFLLSGEGGDGDIEEPLKKSVLFRGGFEVVFLLLLLLLLRLLLRLLLLFLGLLRF